MMLEGFNFLCVQIVGNKYLLVQMVFDIFGKTTSEKQPNSTCCETMCSLSIQSV